MAKRCVSANIYSSFLFTTRLLSLNHLLHPFASFHHHFVLISAMENIESNCILGYFIQAGVAGLNYIALGVGLTGASQINARLLDRVYIWLSERERKRWEAKRGEIEAGGTSNSEKSGEKEKGEKTPERKKFGRPEFRLRSYLSI